MQIDPLGVLVCFTQVLLCHCWCRMALYHFTRLPLGQIHRLWLFIVLSVIGYHLCHHWTTVFYKEIFFYNSSLACMMYDLRLALMTDVVKSVGRAERWQRYIKWERKKITYAKRPKTWKSLHIKKYGAKNQPLLINDESVGRLSKDERMVGW